jgi:hypothetical protein
MATRHAPQLAEVRSISPARDRAIELVLHEGHTPTAAIRRVADEGLIGASALKRTAVAMAAMRQGRERTTFTHRDFIPWSPIKREHRSQHYVRCLRAYSKMMQDGEVSNLYRELVDGMIRALHPTDEVITYEPDNGGFILVPRRYRVTEAGQKVAVDEGWIRDPRIDDNGNRESPSGW